MTEVEQKYLEDINQENDKKHYETVSCDNVFAEFDLENLKAFAKVRKLDVFISPKLERLGDKEKMKLKYIENLAKDCRQIGYKSTLLECPLYVMHMLTKKLDPEYLKISPKTGVENKLTLPVLRKRCYEKMLEDGFMKYFTDYMEDVDDLVKVVKYFGRIPWSKKK